MIDLSRFLSRIYRPEVTYLKSVEILGPRKYRFSFTFPEYGLASEPIDHVSGIQMHLAVFQAFISAIFVAKEMGHIDDTLAFKDVFSAKIVRENVDFFSEVKPNVSVNLEFKLFIHGQKVLYGKRERKFFRVNFSGFVKGEAEAVA